MKNTYDLLEIKVIPLTQEDVITASIDSETDTKDDIFG